MGSDTCSDQCVAAVVLITFFGSLFFFLQGYYFVIRTFYPEYYQSTLPAGTVAGKGASVHGISSKVDAPQHHDDNQALDISKKDGTISPREVVTAV